MENYVVVFKTKENILQSEKWLSSEFVKDEFIKIATNEIWHWAILINSNNKIIARYRKD